ncbi:MAG TPA: choice-of-anchor D domain-containing protein, partial [Blastocatellia bacterium]|nr:choice-of-anchor D domain-containing protein [Blastocatellia bacterium]
MTGHRGRLAGTLLLLLSATAAAQVPFSLLATQPGVSAVTIQNGSAITMGAPVGGTQTAQIVITYTGTGQVTIPQQPSIVGSGVFTATLSGKPPLSLSQGGSAIVNVTFSPANGSQDTAELSLPYVETLSATQSNGGTISLGLQGIAPTFSLYYVLQSNQNAVALAPGGQIPFPATVVGSTSQASLNVTNTGSGVGVVTGISIAGAGFSLQGTPPFPAPVVANGGNLQVVVIYTPTAIGSNSGQITISFGSGSPVTVDLAGTGISASFTYQLLTTPATSVAPGGTISFPGTNVSQSSSITVRVLNSGTASGAVNSIVLAGQGYQFVTPPVVPQTLAPNASLTFTINFTPTQPGSFTGTVLVNSDTFTLSGTGLGPLLVFSYLANGASVTLSAPNNSVIFSPVMITQSKQLTFDIKNTGTLPATISNIGVNPTGGPYSLSGAPPLPLTLAPNGDLTLLITFTPAVLGDSNGTLLLDATSVTLVGSGTQPPPLPSYTISGPNGTASPFS